jgi:hypothetical protein
VRSGTTRRVESAEPAEVVPASGGGARKTTSGMPVAAGESRSGDSRTAGSAGGADARGAASAPSDVAAAGPRPTGGRTERSADGSAAAGRIARPTRAKRRAGAPRGSETIAAAGARDVRRQAGGGTAELGSANAGGERALSSGSGERGSAAAPGAGRQAARAVGTGRRGVGETVGAPAAVNGGRVARRIASRASEDVSAAGDGAGRRTQAGARVGLAVAREGGTGERARVAGRSSRAAVAGASDGVRPAAARSGAGRAERVGLGNGDLLIASAGFSERVPVGIAGDELGPGLAGGVARRTARGAGARDAAPSGAGDDERRVAGPAGRTSGGRAISDPTEQEVEAQRTAGATREADAGDVAVGPTRSQVSRTPGLELVGRRGAGSLAFALARYSGGDWDCDKTAMPNLAYQLDRRVGILVSTEARTVALTDPALQKQPFVFLSGHKAIRLSDAELAALRKYIAAGGSVWINDSTHEHDETFDRAVRRELARLFPDQPLVKLPMKHAVFRSCYDLSDGFKGYRVPPGDKYRCDYLEGIQVDGRTAVIYTRNDYGDGLEIDPRTAPLMQSLTDLSPGDMQEGSVRMGINIALYFLRTRLGPGNTDQIARTIRENTHRAARDEQAAVARAATSVLDGFDEELAWEPQKDWGDDVQVSAVSRPVGGQPNRAMSVRVQVGRKRLSAISRDLFEQVDLSKRHALVLDVTSRMPAGCRVAIGLITMPGWQYFESPPAYIRPGRNPNVVFRLDQPHFKCEASGWKFNRRVANLDSVRKLVLIVQPLRGGTLEIDNLRAATFRSEPGDE